MYPNLAFPFVRTFVRTLVRPFGRTFIRPSVRTFIRPFARPFIRTLLKVGKLITVILVFDNFDNTRFNIAKNEESKQ